MSITVSSVGGVLLACPTDLPTESAEAAQLGILLGWASAVKKAPLKFGDLISQVTTVLSQIGWTVSQSDQSSLSTTSAQLSSAIWEQASAGSSAIAELQQFAEASGSFGAVGNFWWKHSFQTESEVGVGIAAAQEENHGTTLRVTGFSLPPADWHRLLTTPSCDQITLSTTTTSFVLNLQIWEPIEATVSEKSKSVQNLMSKTVTSAT